MVFLSAAIVFLSLSPVLANKISITNAKLRNINTTAHTCWIQFDISWENSWNDSPSSDANGKGYTRDAVWLFFKYTTNYDSSGDVIWKHGKVKFINLSAGYYYYRWIYAFNNSAGTYACTGTTCTAAYPSDYGFFVTTKFAAYYPSTSSLGYLGLVPSLDQMGAFLMIIPYFPGSGNVNAQGVTLPWTYSDNGVTDSQISDATKTAIKVFGIEMVQVPFTAGTSFKVGDGNGVSEAAYAFHATDNTAVSISSLSNTSGIKSDSGDPGDLDSVNGGSGITTLSTGGINDGTDANALFPTGLTDFFVMKHEIPQGMYRDFLNTSTRYQQTKHVASTISADSISNYYVMTNSTSVTNRNGIRAPSTGNGTASAVVFGCDLDGDGTFNESTDGEWVAMNYMKWADFAAVADWAGLRPITEMEYEKVARGTTTPVYGEFAWGSSAIADSNTNFQAITNSGQTSEVGYSVGNGLCNYDSDSSDYPGGPLRVGFAATSSTTTRITAGATYSGAMDLSGNLQEMTVSVGNSTGRTFKGTDGDGELTVDGYATNTDWPGYDGSSVSGATGSGTRGGGYKDASTYARISDRSTASTEVSARDANVGGRLARTAKGLLGNSA